jgi:hypothetical protein
MQVVVHEYMGIDTAAGAVLVDSEGEKILLKIGGILEDALFLVAAYDDVVESTGELDAGFAWHGATITEEGRIINLSIIKSDPIRFFS